MKFLRNMSQRNKSVWEAEYAAHNLMRGTKPAKAFTNFVKWVRKQEMLLEGSQWLDLGSGEGKNMVYLAERGAYVLGIEIAANAVATSRDVIRRHGLSECVEIVQGSMGVPFNMPKKSIDCIVDVTSSNSLDEQERSVYLSECQRVLKTAGFMFVRALAKDGDNNAKRLLKDSPGPETDTYIMPEWGLTERVFSKHALIELYAQYFDIVHLEKETHYTSFGGKKYKRNFWIMYLKTLTSKSSGSFK